MASNNGYFDGAIVDDDFDDLLKFLDSDLQGEALTDLPILDTEEISENAQLNVMKMDQDVPLVAVSPSQIHQVEQSQMTAATSSPPQQVPQYGLAQSPTLLPPATCTESEFSTPPSVSPSNLFISSPGNSDVKPAVSSGRRALVEALSQPAQLPPAAAQSQKSSDINYEFLAQCIKTALQAQDQKHQKELQEIKEQQAKIQPQFKAVLEKGLSLAISRLKKEEQKSVKTEPSKGVQPNCLTKLLMSTPPKTRPVQVAMAPPVGPPVGQAVSPPAVTIPTPVVAQHTALAPRPAQTIQPTVIALSSTAQARDPVSAAPVTLVASSGQTILPTGIQLPIQVVEGDRIPLPRLKSSQTIERPEKKNSHNAVEKRYRSSINDRVKELASLVAGSDSKLTKSSTLQRAIDYIGFLKRENARLKHDKEILMKALEDHGVTVEDRPMVEEHRGLVDDQPTPPPSDVGSSSEAELSPKPSEQTMFSEEVTVPGSSSLGLSHMIFPAVLFSIVLFNPLGMIMGGNSMDMDESRVHSGARALQSISDESGMLWRGIFVWLANFVIVMVIFYKLVIAGEPVTEPDSVSAANYTRHRARAERALNTYHTAEARVQLCESLRWLGRYVPSGLGVYGSLIWQVLRHSLYVASLSKWLAARRVISAAKLQKVQQSARDASVVLHRLSELELLDRAEDTSGLTGVTLAVKAVNLGELAYPSALDPAQLAEMYASAALHVLNSQSGWADHVARYCLRRCSRLLREHPTSLPAAVDWLSTRDGVQFVLSRDWNTSGEHDSTFTQLDDPTSALSVVRCQYREQLLERVVVELVSPGYLQDTTTPQLGEHVQQLVQQTDILLDACKPEPLDLSAIKRKQSLKLVDNRGADAVCMWWTNVLRSCIHEQINKDSTKLPPSPTSTSLTKCVSSCLEARRLSHAAPELACDYSVLRMCQAASGLLQQMTKKNAKTSQLRMAFETLAAEALLAARVDVWERQTNGPNTGQVTSQTQLRHFQQDLNMLRQLANDWPAALPKVLVYEGLCRLMAGAGPGRTHQLLVDNTRRQRQNTDDDAAPERGFSEKERALALLMAAKHLPRSAMRTDSSKQKLLSESEGCYQRLGDERGVQRCHVAAAK